MLLLVNPFWKISLGIFHLHPFILLYGNQGGVKKDGTRDALKSKKLLKIMGRSILQVEETLKKSREKYNTQHD